LFSAAASMESHEGDVARARRIRELFDAALEVEPAQRHRFLAESCKTDSELRDCVANLVAHAERMGEFLARPLSELEGVKRLEVPTSGEPRSTSPGSASPAPDASAVERARSRTVSYWLAAGERVGDFEVEAPLASGAWGQVYRARQLSLGGRPVALK